jgi:hypothetical protein
LQLEPYDKAHAMILAQRAQFISAYSETVR